MISTNRYELLYTKTVLTIHTIYTVGTYYSSWICYILMYSYVLIKNSTISFDSIGKLSRTIIPMWNFYLLSIDLWNNKFNQQCVELHVQREVSITIVDDDHLYFFIFPFTFMDFINFLHLCRPSEAILWYCAFLIVSRKLLKFKLEELVRLYLVINTMGYHLKIFTIRYDDK